MGIEIWSGTYGYIIIALIVFLLIMCFVMYMYMMRRRKSNVMRMFQKAPHQYAIVEQHPDDNVMRTKRNQIQPPTRVKVKLVPTQSPTRFQDPRNISRTRKKKMLRYSEVEEEDEKEIKKNSFQKSNYKRKMVTLLNVDDERISEEDDDVIPSTSTYPINIENGNNAFNNNDNSNKRSSIRLMRADSSVSNKNSLGQINFILCYSKVDEYLTVNLLSGRHIHSTDHDYTVNLPVVSINIEGDVTHTEVTSSPDDPPNPEYDQEFTFDGITPEKLLTTVLRFIVLDIISAHAREVRVLGFFRVDLREYSTVLGDKGESGGIRREISTYLYEGEKKGCVGELLLSLMYDCVTDRVIVTVLQIKGLLSRPDDTDVYIKISLLLDNDVIQTKRTSSFKTSSQNINICQTFEFNALSADLELLSSTSDVSKMTLALKDKEVEIKSTSSENLKSNMGVLCEVRVTTESKSKRVIGCVYVGCGRHSKHVVDDEYFHWEEMVRHFDNTITKWHVLRSDE